MHSKFFRRLGTAFFFAAILISCSSRKGNLAKNGGHFIPTIDQVGALNLPEQIAPIKAPFAMPQLKRPEFPAFSLNITSKGAKEGAKVTKEIQAAIDETSSRGGGSVVIPAEMTSNDINFKNCTPAKPKGWND